MRAVKDITKENPRDYEVGWIFDQAGAATGGILNGIYFCNLRTFTPLNTIISASMDTTAIEDLLTQILAQLPGTLSTAANQALQITEEQDINAELDTQTTLLTTIGNNTGIVPSNVNIDAAGRTRVSAPRTMLSFSHDDGDPTTQIDEEVIGTGSSALSLGVMTMSVATTSDSVIRQTFETAPYFKGKPIKFNFTFDQFDAETSVEKWVLVGKSSTTSPYTGTIDGFKFWRDDTKIYFSIYRDGTHLNSGTDDSANWFDPLDGTGPSGIDYSSNWGNFTVIFGDYLYLGGTSVRAWVAYEGKSYLFFQFNHAGKRAGTIVRSPKFNIQYGIRATAAVTGDFGMVCAEITAEGAERVNQRSWAVHMDGGQVRCASTANYYALLGVKLNSRDASVAFKGITAKIDGNNDGLLLLVRNPTLGGGAVTTTAHPSIPIDLLVGNLTAGTPTTASGFEEVDGWLVTGAVSISESLENIQERPGSYINATGSPYGDNFDQYWIVLKCEQNNMDAHATLSGIYYQ